MSDFKIPIYDNYLVLTTEEVDAVVKELKDTFVSKDNLLCEQVVYRMMAFLKDRVERKEKENAGTS